MRERIRAGHLPSGVDKIPTRSGKVSVGMFRVLRGSRHAHEHQPGGRTKKHDNTKLRCGTLRAHTPHTLVTVVSLKISDKIGAIQRTNVDSEHFALAHQRTAQIELASRTCV